MENEYYRKTGERVTSGVSSGFKIQGQGGVRQWAVIFSL